MTAIFTIIAKNYLAFARTLMQSAKVHQPNWRRFVILIDECEGHFDPDGEVFETIDLSLVSVPKLPLMRFKYSVMELSTAVKPFIFRYLFETYHLTNVFYFDPDILLLASPDNLEKRLEDHDLVLTPHCCAPLPPDDRKPQEKDFLMSGVFNLGFIGIRYCSNSSHFLHWWEGKLYDGAYADFANHLFTDQKWIDLVPCLFPGVCIERSPVFNVAYWNLGTRKVVSLNGQWMVDGEPMVFFHFSGLNPEHPSAFSKHQDRYRLADLGELASLVRSYCKMVLDDGHATSKHWRYTYDYFVNGSRVDPMLREFGKEDLLGEWLDPFSDAGYQHYVAFWNAPVPEPGSDRHVGITRLAQKLYRMRTDVQLLMPDIFGSDHQAFLHWFVNSGKAEYKLDETFLEPVRQYIESNVSSDVKKISAADPEPVDPLQTPPVVEDAVLRSADSQVGAMGLPGPVVSVLLRGGVQLEYYQWISKCDEKAVNWLLEPDGDPLPRLARWIYADRADLRHVAPKASTRDLRLFAHWLVVFGREEYQLPEPWVHQMARSMGVKKFWWWDKYLVKLRLALRRQSA